MSGERVRFNGGDLSRDTVNISDPVSCDRDV